MDRDASLRHLNRDTKAVFGFRLQMKPYETYLLGLGSNECTPWKHREEVCKKLIEKNPIQEYSYLDVSTRMSSNAPVLLRRSRGLVCPTLLSSGAPFLYHSPLSSPEILAIYIVASSGTTCE
ncbi:hypothetical protein Y032_0139g2094 [Ancylostoma ceylanicum]|uniref:Uncharacterized protein n=1 Tax=Ancylostoma ceylanicum TaxID=53326 RepID=A0A016T4C7_9BILA|nr:hypothetical protein Y032_0139g2094 [Ancylostoma ceylanicum]